MNRLTKFVGCGAICIVTVLSIGQYRARRERARAVADARAYVDATEGDALCPPDGRPWAPPGSNAFIIVASASCSACKATKSFDQEIDEYGRNHGQPVFYVLDDRPINHDRDRELTSLGRKVIRMHSLHEFGLARVPTIARVDSHGIIQSK